MYLLQASAIGFNERDPYFVRKPRTPGRVCNFTYDWDEATQIEGLQRANEKAAGVQAALRARYPAWSVRVVRLDSVQ